MKNKFKMFFDKHGTALAYLAIFTLIFGSLFNLEAFDSIHYVRRSPVTDTVTYKDDSNIRPIYVSWVSKGSDDTKKLAPKLESLDTSPETYGSLIHPSLHIVNLLLLLLMVG